jgi:hypothetical protein
VSAREFTEEENRILNEVLRLDKRDAPKQSSKEGERRIAELAKLSPLKFAQCNKQEAKDLGITPGELNRLVRMQRARNEDDEQDFLPHWKVEQWPEEVDGAALLDELRNYFTRYVVLPEEADVALALWVLHTWVFECFDVTPYLAITSPTPRCGKTVLMTMLYWLCCRAKKTDSMSKAVIYRSVDADKPTLVLDEVGWICSVDDERAGIVNGGFERNGYVETCEGEGVAIKPKRWSTYCPKALGRIGRLTSTLMDRSIEITMRRKTSGEIVIHRAFGSNDAMRSADLVKELTSDPERPWVEWRNGKPLTQKQLGGLLRPFGIISETVHIPGLAHAKGYQRVRFEDAWRRYLPGQNGSSDAFPPFEACKRASADAAGTSGDFQSVRKENSHVSKNDDLSYSRAGLHACTLRTLQNAEKIFAAPDEEMPSVSSGAVPDTLPGNSETARTEFGSVRDGTPAHAADELGIPPFLDRRPQPRQDGPWANSYVSDDDAAFLESGKFK